MLHIRHLLETFIIPTRYISPTAGTPRALVTADVGGSVLSFTFILKDTGTCNAACDIMQWTKSSSIGKEKKKGGKCSYSSFCIIKGGDQIKYSAVDMPF